MSRLMAIDFGLKRVGLAVTDPLGMFATALDTVARKEVKAYIKKYHQEHTIRAFIIGEPRTLANEPSSVAGAAAAFRRELLVDFPDIPQHGVDERFTSRIALQTIAGSDLPRLKRREKGLADRISAVLLLQSYLETVQHLTDLQTAGDVSNELNGDVSNELKPVVRP
ncbi:MAG: Holliday junction resolvase RuvX [Bacteroidetes bacterium]|nr:Holliday junction resolvase RuvX [Bacteroidota bacterium]